MLITDVQIHHCAMSEQDNFVRGVVELKGENRGIQMMCRAVTPQTPAGGTVRDRLIRDAVRQLRRMPEFRSGDMRFAFAPGLLNAS